MSLTMSRRRSSESSGMGTRNERSAAAGLRPSLHSRIARSMSRVVEGSKGWTMSMRGSGVLMTARLLSLLTAP